jgi:uncharacterized protein YdhG (YjbR/CyaY superfamily)
MSPTAPSKVMDWRRQQHGQTTGIRNDLEYIETFPPETQSILRKIRLTIRKAAPRATAKISYRMPAFFLDGVLIYFAAFKNHIGIYPPVHGDAKLIAKLSRYRGEKGNLKFPLDEPIPYDLITKVVKLRMKQQQERAQSRPKKR